MSLTIISLFLPSFFFFFQTAIATLISLTKQQKLRYPYHHVSFSIPKSISLSYNFSKHFHLALPKLECYYFSLTNFQIPPIYPLKATQTFILPKTSFWICTKLQQVNYKKLINIHMQSRKGWSQLEDDRLIKIIKKYGMKNWTLVSQKLSLGSTTERTGKQCRERWHNHLNPTINHQAWSRRDDEILFEAHRKYGSKWKQISKLFEGRTDNSIKNHFYSTVRRCLRRISKLAGGHQTTITMKSVKPFVLSKIVENTELTNLILKIGRDKTRGRSGEGVDLDAATVAKVSSELKRISAEYEERQNGGATEGRRSPQSPSRRSIQSLSSESKLPELQPAPKPEEVKKMRPEDETLRCYFEEESKHHDREELILQTHHQSKERHQSNFEGSSFRLFDDSHHKERVQTAEKEKEEEYWVEQEQSHSFFNSPSCRRNKFPDVRLLAKVSRNSQSPGCGGPHAEQRISSALKVHWSKQEKMEISFDPKELFSANFAECKENDQQ